jgi:hypothetical protein
VTRRTHPTPAYHTGELVTLWGGVVLARVVASVIDFLAAEALAIADGRPRGPARGRWSPGDADDVSDALLAEACPSLAGDATVLGFCVSFAAT